MQANDMHIAGTQNLLIFDWNKHYSRFDIHFE